MRALCFVLVCILSGNLAAAEIHSTQDDSVAAYCYGLWQVLKSQPGICENPPESQVESCAVTAAAFQARMNLAASYLQTKGRTVDQFPNEVKQASADRVLVRVDPNAQDRMRRCEAFLARLP